MDARASHEADCQLRPTNYLAPRMTLPTISFRPHLRRHHNKEATDLPFPSSFLCLFSFHIIKFHYYFLTLSPFFSLFLSFPLLYPHPLPCFSILVFPIHPSSPPTPPSVPTTPYLFPHPSPPSPYSSPYFLVLAEKCKMSSYYPAH